MNKTSIWLTEGDLFALWVILSRLKYSALLSAQPVWNCERMSESNVKFFQNVWAPPAEKSCEHQKRGLLDCNCPDSCPPDGWNIQIFNDKKSKNRWLHIPSELFKLLLMHADIRCLPFMNKMYSNKKCHYFFTHLIIYM